VQQDADMLPRYNLFCVPPMHLRNGRNAGNGACAPKGTTSRMTVASRPKVTF
jgi:hypothetical protein